MLTNSIPRESLDDALNDVRWVRAIILEAKDGESEALVEMLRVMTAPTMAEPGAKLFLPYQDSTAASLALAGIHWAEEPPSRICHIVSNIQIAHETPPSRAPGEIGVRSRFIVYRNRVETETDFLGRIGARFSHLPVRLTSRPVARSRQMSLVNLCRKLRTGYAEHGEDSISLRPDAPGIPPEIRQQIFDSFFTGHARRADHV